MKKLVAIIFLMTCLPAFAQRFVDEVPNLAALKARNVSSLDKSVFVRGGLTQNDGLGGIYTITNSIVGADGFLRVQSTQNPAWSYDRWVSASGPLIGSPLNLSELNLGTIAGASTATLVIATNFYRATFSGSTWNINLPVVPNSTNRFWEQVVGTNTSGGTQIGTLKVANVATAMYNEALHEAVTTITNESGAAFTITFRASNGIWKRVDVEGDGGNPSSGGFWGESGGVLFPSPSTPEIDFVNYADLGDSTTNIFWSGAVDDSQTFNQYGDMYFIARSTTGNANFSLDSVSGVNATLFNVSLTPTTGALEMTLNKDRFFYVNPSSVIELLPGSTNLISQTILSSSTIQTNIGGPAILVQTVSADFNRHFSSDFDAFPAHEIQEQSTSGDSLYQMNRGGSIYLRLQPTGAPGVQPAFFFKTSQDWSGNTNLLFAMANQANRIFGVAGNSGYDGSGLHFLSDDGTYKPSGTNSLGGTNTFAIINQSNGYLPYRTNSTTLADSPIQRITSTTIGLNSPTNILTTSGASLVYTNAEPRIAVVSPGGTAFMDVDDSGQVAHYEGGSSSAWFANGNQRGVIAFDTELAPSANDTISLGSGNNRWKGISLSAPIYWNGPTNTVFDTSGNGDPNGSITADKGSTYRRFDGGAGTCFYVKETSGVNTGWAPK